MNFRTFFCFLRPSFGHGQCSVTAAWATRSPCSILQVFVTAQLIQTQLKLEWQCNLPPPYHKIIRPLPGNPGSWFSVCDLFFSKYPNFNRTTQGPNIHPHSKYWCRVSFPDSQGSPMRFFKSSKYILFSWGTHYWSNLYGTNFVWRGWLEWGWQWKRGEHTYIPTNTMQSLIKCTRVSQAWWRMYCHPLADYKFYCSRPTQAENLSWLHALH